MTNMRSCAKGPNCYAFSTGFICSCKEKDILIKWSCLFSLVENVFDDLGTINLYLENLYELFRDITFSLYDVYFCAYTFIRPVYNIK